LFDGLSLGRSLVVWTQRGEAYHAHLVCTQVPCAGYPYGARGWNPGRGLRQEVLAAHGGASRADAAKALLVSLERRVASERTDIFCGVKTKSSEGYEEWTNLGEGTSGAIEGVTVTE
jgi:hypothetical protein